MKSCPQKKLVSDTDLIEIREKEEQLPEVKNPQEAAFYLIRDYSTTLANGISGKRQTKSLHPTVALREEPAEGGEEKRVENNRAPYYDFSEYTED